MDDFEPADNRKELHSAWETFCDCLRDSADGVFRAVISQRDPGIANWLDTTGATHGHITYRWNQADSNPVPALELVAFDDLAARLDDRWTPITRDEHSEVLRRRRRGALRRFRR